MTVQTRPPRGGGSTRRDRLPRGAAPVSRRREITLGVFGSIGLLLLVVGIPVALSLFVGYPLPRSAPSADWLTVAVSATLIIKILACVVWVVWAHFVVCLLAEWRSIRRGRVPGHVALGGGSQMLARRLVAAALLLAGAATTFSQVAGAGSGSASNAAIVSAVHQQVTNRAVPASTAVATPEADRAATAAPAAAKNAPLKYYVVQPPHGRRYDSLWDIAERTLKDPLRYKEIFALNHDRTQADGRKLMDANLIQPGWQLRLPADASGPGVHSTPAPAGPGRTPASDDANTLPAQQLDERGASTVAVTHQQTPAMSSPAVSAPSSSRGDLPTTLLGGGLMLAGIALALTARRGPYELAGPDEDQLTAAADLGLARSLDRALRNLAAARKDQGLELPQPVLAWASADEVSLALAGGDTSVAPAPWRAESDSMWTCPLSALTDHPRLAETPAPFPGLLSVGRDGSGPDAGRELFVDFEQAPGLISVGGHEERARDLVTSLAAQAVTCVWSDGARATLVGFSDGAQLAELDAHRISHTTNLGTVLDDLERQQSDLARLQRSLGVDGVLNGRQNRRSVAWAPHLVVLSGPPSNEDAHRLARLVGYGRSQFVVLVVGDVLHAAWRFVIDSARDLDLGVLGAHASAHQLDRNAMLQMIETLRTAGESAAEQDSRVAALAPRAALAHHAEDNDPSGGGAGLAVRRERPERSAARASVLVLGPVDVRAAGPMAADKRELATEIVVAVALAPTGIPGVVLRSAIWPRGVSDDVFTAAMRETAAWLGTDAAGRPALREVDGRWLLGASVWVDWEDLQLAVQSAHGPAELDNLRYAVSLLRGEGFSGVPARRYGWLSFRRSARDAAVVVTSVARRAAGLLTSNGQLADAEQVLRAGLGFVPTAEPLWRDLLELAGGRGPDGAAAVAQEMYAVLSAHRVWAQPETDALVSQLAPGQLAPGQLAPGQGVSESA